MASRLPLWATLKTHYHFTRIPYDFRPCLRVEFAYKMQPDGRDRAKEKQGLRGGCAAAQHWICPLLALRGLWPRPPTTQEDQGPKPYRPQQRRQGTSGLLDFRGLALQRLQGKTFSEEGDRPVSQLTSSR